MEQVKTLAFTGMRAHKLPWGTDEGAPACLSLKIAVKALLAGLIELENVRRFISGMAMGVDMICAELVLELKACYPDIALVAAIPYRDQDMLWPQEQRERYARILPQCGEIHVISEEYTDDCVEIRSRWMVDECDLLLAVWDGKPGGGAGDAAEYAREKDKRVIVINPFDMTREDEC